MIKTIIVLILTLILLPIATFYLDDPLTAEQLQALQVCLIMYASVSLLCFVVAEITRNCSQVDKLWSIMPLVYVWYIASQSGFDNRLVLMAVMVTLWGARLTFNFGRKGGYTWRIWAGEEDYRWEVLRKNPALKGPVRWGLFNLIFISFYQQGLILLFSLPALVALKSAGTPLSIFDYIIAAVMLGFIIIETIADQQQWNFQKQKHKILQSGQNLPPPYSAGFVQSGLWKWSRHPNYMAEQAVWIVFYFFSVSATGQWFNWSMAGFLLLIILFQGSSDFSEKISSSKYPAYVDYIKKTGRFIPKIL
ncbi:MAG: DUF1295 domain-containing protein [Candidatus Competibacteraceae bacterium]|nr:DUF1295 domain-containing protein [Candidatus Competibacteraceae bacterium]